MTIFDFSFNIIKSEIPIIFDLIFPKFQKCGLSKLILSFFL